MISFFRSFNLNGFVPVRLPVSGYKLMARSLNVIKKVFGVDATGINSCQKSTNKKNEISGVCAKKNA